MRFLTTPICKLIGAEKNLKGIETFPKRDETVNSGANCQADQRPLKTEANHRLSTGSDLSDICSTHCKNYVNISKGPFDLTWWNNAWIKHNFHQASA